MKDENLGGPANTKEKCKSCGLEWTRYRLGSFDYKYKDCPKCEGKILANKLMTPQAPAFREWWLLMPKHKGESPIHVFLFEPTWETSSDPATRLVHVIEHAALATLTTELASLKEEYGHMYKVVQSLDAEMCEVKWERDMHTGEHSCEIAKVTAERDRLRAANEVLRRGLNKAYGNKHWKEAAGIISDALSQADALQRAGVVGENGKG